MYKYLDKLNVKSNLPNHQISEYAPKKFRTSEEICKYDCSFEESYLASCSSDVKESLEDRRQSAVTSSSSSSLPLHFPDGRRKSSVLRNEEIMKSLAALKEDVATRSNEPIAPLTSTNNNHLVSHSVTARNNSTMLRMKAETAAEMYIGVEDTGKFLRFLDFYVSLYETSPSTFEASDAKIVKSFDLFDGDVKKSGEFLVVAEELEELGFEEDKVVSALMLNSNDREAALDFLMKN